MSHKAVKLDVREALARGREPFGLIMRCVAGLKANEDLLLIAPFEPKPLYGVLAQHGFGYESTMAQDGHWEIRFTRTGQNEPAPARTEAPPVPPRAGRVAPANPAKVVEVDARGLEPPQPLVKILEALASLPEDADLRAHTDRRPMHLYSQLEERGFKGETAEQPDGSFSTYVQRA